MAAQLPTRFIAARRRDCLGDLRDGEECYILPQWIDLDLGGRMYLWTHSPLINEPGDNRARIRRVPDGFLVWYDGPPFTPGKRSIILWLLSLGLHFVPVVAFNPPREGE